MPLYFAYGSNMDQAQMKSRCPNATLKTTAVLPHHKLAFTIFSPKRRCGCADVVESKDDSVYGLLYELSEEELLLMDGFEGCPTAYQRILVKVLDTDGREHNAYTYEVATKREGLYPSEEYLGLILKAAKHFAFPEAYSAMLERQKTKEN